MSRMPPLNLTLFGSFAAGPPAQSLRLPTNKTRALLAYLALTPDTPLRRESLAGLFWPEQPEVMARQNLRKTAGRLKHALHEYDPALAESLLSLTKQTIGLHAADCVVDARVFREHLETARRHAHASLGQCAACRAGLEEAVGLYRRGDLLAGLSLPDAAPFEEWLLLQRENLHHQQLTALHLLTGAYADEGALEKARQYAQWQIQHEPWHEAGHRQLMRLQAAHGQRAEAIAQYQACRRVLEAELGVEPSAETEALLTQIMDGALPVVAAHAPATRSVPWPKPASPLIGRAADIRQVTNLLAEPGIRVVTLTGLGGIGKTSLALAVGEQLRQTPPPWLPDGVYFVPLAEVTEADMLPAAVAEAVGIVLNLRQSIATQVEQFLRGQALLLILDNVELAGLEVEWLHRLATTAAHLKLLVTAREPLNWQTEWRYPLEGLAFPLAEAEGGEQDAVQLFVRAARQVQPGFAYTAENGRAITRICRLVQGWPLALQMAATWVRTMPCAAIAEQIDLRLDLLTSSLRDIPPRQRSIGIIFDHTWATLSDAERASLARLAVFRGGFSLAAAMEVAAASPWLLRGLVDKALVRHQAAGDRYDMHQVLRQFALAKAQAEPDTHREAQQAHSRCYLHLLQTQGERLNTTAFQAAVDVIKADIDNVRQAWQWAAGEQQHDQLARNLGHIATFYESSQMLQEAVVLSQRTLAALPARGPERPAGFVAQVLYHMAHSLLLMGQYAAAALRASEARDMARALEDVELVSQLYIVQADIYREQGHYDQTHAMLHEAIDFCRARGYWEGMARALHAQGNAYWYMSAFDQARACYESGRDIYHQLGHVTRQANLTGNIGVVLWREGKFQEALELYHVALEAVRQVGEVKRVAVWLGNIGLVYADLGEDERAVAYMDEALEMHDRLGRTYYKVDLLLAKAFIQLRRGDVDGATTLHQQALAVAYQIGNRNYLLDCDLWLARLYGAQGRTAEARALLHSLRVREFRSDAAAAIAHALDRLLASAPAVGAVGTGPSAGLAHADGRRLFVPRA